MGRGPLSSSAPARSPAFSFPRRDEPRPHSVLSCDRDIVLLFETEFQSVDQAGLVISSLCLQSAVVKSKGHTPAKVKIVITKYRREQGMCHIHLKTVYLSYVCMHELGCCVPGGQ